MNADQLKQHIIMLRSQRAAVQLQIAHAVQDRHATIIEFDNDINEKTTIALDLDVQIAEHMRDYATKLRQPDTSDKPYRPLGPKGELIQVHPTMAHIFDAVTTAGVYTVPKALNTRNSVIVSKFCADLVDLGVARWKDGMTLVPPNHSGLQNPVGMPSPGRGGRP